MTTDPLHIIDSHTEGEPTRLIVSGGPDLGSGSVADLADTFGRDHAVLRRALCREPRGHDAVVGGMILPTSNPDCLCGAFFFNNATTIPMCVHGTIGLVATLKHLGSISVGHHRIDTPVGIIDVELMQDGRVEVTNVPSRVFRSGVTLDVPDWGPITGDIAWGGNGFFAIAHLGPTIAFENIPELTRFGLAVKKALADAELDRVDGITIDHVEIFGPPSDPSLADSQNFVLCPGNAYDRSPCGTGISAKLACLHAAGKIAPDTTWRQAGILNTIFTGRIARVTPDHITPVIGGRAWILSEATHHFDPTDPFLDGIG